MKNIEIKQIIDGELAVVMDGIDQTDLPLGSANTYLNLDNIIFFRTYKSNEKRYYDKLKKISKEMFISYS